MRFILGLFPHFTCQGFKAFNGFRIISTTPWEGALYVVRAVTWSQWDILAGTLFACMITFLSNRIDCGGTAGCFGDESLPRRSWSIMLSDETHLM
jgi:hypothetical protein